MEQQQLECLIELHVDIKRNLQDTFEGLLNKLSVNSRYKDGSGKSMDMKIEAWPGGRWYRDLGNNTGHCWGFVQTIKPPHVLELNGPLFMSYAATNHIQFKLSEVEGGTRVSMRHHVFGIIPEEVRLGMPQGWGGDLQELKQELEGAA